MYCETCAYPFASASANGRVCFCCLSDGAHHQLYQSALLPVGKDCKESRQRRGKVSISVSCWFMAELKLPIVKSSLCLYPTLLSLHRLLQQKLSHTLPVFEQLLGTFPQ